MKVALVLTGLMRCYEQAYPSFKQYVLDRYDTDVYIDTWTEIGYYTGKGYLPPNGEYVKVDPTAKGFHDSGQLVDVTHVMQLYDPVSLHIEKFSALEPYFDALASNYELALTRPKNTLAQAYKTASGLNLISADTYELVIRARPDLVLEGDPGYFSPDEFLTLPSRNSRGTGTGDSIQIGSEENLFRYANLFELIPRAYDEIGHSCPHDYAEWIIKKEQLPWREMNVGAHVAHSPRGAYQEPV